MKKLALVTVALVVILLLMGWGGASLALDFGRNQRDILNAQASIEQARAMQEVGRAAQAAAQAAQTASAGQTVFGVGVLILAGITLLALIAAVGYLLYLRTQTDTGQAYPAALPRTPQHPAMPDPQTQLLQQITQMLLLEILERRMALPKPESDDETHPVL